MTMLQGGAVPMSGIELLTMASLETKIVVAICVLFSAASWFVIGLKWWQFRRLNRQAVEDHQCPVGQFAFVRAHGKYWRQQIGGVRRPHQEWKLE